MEWHRGPHSVSDEADALQLDVVHGYLTRSYWCAGISRELVRRSLANSHAFGVYRREPAPARQVGFARVITDHATFAYLADVFVLEAERGQGLATFLVECIHAHPELQGLRRWLLVTRDAHALYEKFGWRVVVEPERHMEIVRRDLYGGEGAR